MEMHVSQPDFDIVIFSTGQYGLYYHLLNGMHFHYYDRAIGGNLLFGLARRMPWSNIANNKMGRDFSRELDTREFIWMVFQHHMAH